MFILKEKTELHHILIIIFISGVINSQTPNLSILERYIESNKWGKTDSIQEHITFSKLDKEQKTKFYFLQGKILFNKSDYNLAFKSFQLARKGYIETKALRNQAEAESFLIECITFLNDESNSINYNIFLESICKIGHLLNDYKIKIDCEFFKGTKALENNEYKKAINHYKQISKIALTHRDSSKYLNNQLNIAQIIGHHEKKSNESIEMHLELIKYFKKKQDFKRQFIATSNLALLYNSIDQPRKAIKFLIQTDSINIKEDILANKSYLYNDLSFLYEKVKNFKKSLIYLKKSNALKDSLSLENKIKEIAKIKEQYDNEKLRADNLEIESKRKQNFNLLVGALGIILFGGLTAFLLQKNTRKKQKLAEQEKALETQKLATVLKEQELISIDAMIEGQEKERQRIANDLHDDLGGLMATVKLYFNELKEKQTSELFDKTTKLLDESYQKIRSISHTKNSGVIANQGLLQAVQNMADKITISNKIVIHVKNHGLENRLENSLELTIFRIIQELITNVLKHANASEVTIHLTNHEEALNILVEDNGIGFNPSQITTKNNGMGISNIDKRVEHLNGTMTIESQIYKGTSIIIDIPT